MVSSCISMFYLEVNNFKWYNISTKCCDGQLILFEYFLFLPSFTFYSLISPRCSDWSSGSSTILPILFQNIYIHVEIHLKMKIKYFNWILYLNQGLVKGAILWFRNPYFHFRHGESTSSASQLTSPASQKRKDLNKVSLQLQDLVQWLH